MQHTLLITLVGILLAIPNTSNAQYKRRFKPKQRFHAGLIIGMNAAQMDGDDFSGYHKRGIMGGLQGVAVINRRLQLVAELLYSQKGARVKYEDILAPLERNRVIALDYAEAPILMRIDLTPQKKEYKTPVYLEAGLSLGRLISTTIEEDLSRVRNSFTGVSDSIKRTELNGIIGLQINIFSNLNIGVRSTSSLTRTYVNPSPDPPVSAIQAQFGIIRNYDFFRNYHLSFYASYQIY